MKSLEIENAQLRSEEANLRMLKNVLEQTIVQFKAKVSERDEIIL